MALEEDSGSGDEIRGRPRLTAEYATGLSETMAIRAGVASLPLDDGRRDYVTTSASTAWGPVYYYSRVSDVDSAQDRGCRG